MVYQEPRRSNKTIDFKTKIEKVKKRLKSEIDAHEQQNGKDGTINQLNKFYNEIELMEKSRGYVPSYPRTIVDTWDFNSQLGKQLLGLYDIYKRLG